MRPKIGRNTSQANSAKRNERMAAGNESAADIVAYFRVFHAHTIEEGLMFKLLSKTESGK